MSTVDYPITIEFDYVEDRYAPSCHRDLHMVCEALDQALGQLELAQQPGKDGLTFKLRVHEKLQVEPAREYRTFAAPEFARLRTHEAKTLQRVGAAVSIGYEDLAHGFEVAKDRLTEACQRAGKVVGAVQFELRDDPKHRTLTVEATAAVDPDPSAQVDADWRVVP